MRLWASALLAFSLPALAGRPLTTEDAGVLDEKRCQVEAWVDRGHDATRSWLVPACKFGGGLEWQLGGARTREGGQSRFSEAYFQAKALLPAAEDAAFRIGIVAGVLRRLENEQRRGWEHPFVTVPASIALGNGAVHLNVGWFRDRETGRDATTWGIAAEAPLTPRFWLVGEAFGENAQRPWFRAGGRYHFGDDFAIDLTVVTRPGESRDERFVSLGVFWQSGRFLP